MRLTAASVLFLIASVLVGVAIWFSGSDQPAAAANASSQEFHVYHEHVLGTSLEIFVAARNQSVADAAEDAILAEIERLRLIFSLYDPASELSRLNRTREPMMVSAEMIEVLQHYGFWQQQTGGAFNGQLGELVNVWKKAEKEQSEPDEITLSRIVEQLGRPGWVIDVEAKTVSRLTDQPLNLNAIAKGYIVQKAAAAARAKAPTAGGLLLNLGGDMAAWGKDAAGQSWSVGVQDPHEPFDNAAPLASLPLSDRAIATSGGYERYYQIQGKKHSHLFDPRTGRSATGAAGATVIAANNVTANALATTLCVLTPEEGLKLIGRLPGVECLIVGHDGTQHRSDTLALLEQPARPAAQMLAFQAPNAKNWPAGYQVSLTVTLPQVDAGKRYRRPYVAIWAEDDAGKPVRTITEWGSNPRWISTLPKWWKFAKNEPELVKAVSRATRNPGKHAVVWDGNDDNGKPLPQGTYTLHVEVHREHGKLVTQTGKLTCGAEAARLVLEKNAETGDTVIEYAKKKSP